MEAETNKSGNIDQQKTKIANEFYDWILRARELVDAHFPNEAASAHNMLVIETAKSMMMMQKLDGIEASVDTFLKSIQYSDGS